MQYVIYMYIICIHVIVLHAMPLPIIVLHLVPHLNIYTRTYVTGLTESHDFKKRSLTQTDPAAHKTVGSVAGRLAFA